jgi:hypothetical protein
MTALRQKMIEDMQLRGFAERTQEAYLLAVRQLARHYGKSPDQIDEEELRQYFLFLKNEKHAARNTCTIALCGIKFFFQHTLGRDWKTLTFYVHPREKTAGGAQHQRGAFYPGMRASPTLSGLSEYDLCLWPAFARRRALAGEPYRQ